MPVPNGIKVPAAFEYVFPAGFTFIGVEPLTDFERRGTGSGDDQARDKDTGERMWQVIGIDNHEDAARFGRVPVVKVKIAAPYQPVPPAAQVAGYRPLVAFEGLTLTPYVDQAKCKAATLGPHKCGGRLAYSIRATSMVDPADLRPSAKPA